MLAAPPDPLGVRLFQSSLLHLYPPPVPFCARLEPDRSTARAGGRAGADSRTAADIRRGGWVCNGTTIPDEHQFCPTLSADPTSPDLSADLNCLVGYGASGLPPTEAAAVLPATG